MLKSLEKILPKSLASVSITTIRRHARKCLPYMDVYRMNTTRKAVKYAVTMYQSHRKVPNLVSTNVNGLPAVKYCALH